MHTRTPTGTLLTDIILEVFRLNGAMLDAGNQLTAPHGLTSARWQVLGAIDLSGQPITVAQIARRMGLARQGVQRIVNDLRGLDMVILENNLDHKRAPLVALTRKAKATLADINKAQTLWVNALSGGLSERQLKQTLKTLQAVRAQSETCAPAAAES